MHEYLNIEAIRIVKKPQVMKQTGGKMQKLMIASGILLLFSVGSILLGMFIDIQIITKYDYTPISFTFTSLFIGSIIGLLLALKTVKQRKVLSTITEE